MQEIRCPDCNREVPVADINMERLIGRCLRCDKMFNIGEALGLSPHASSRVGSLAQKPVRPKHPQPPNFKLENTLRGHRIQLRWFTPVYIFLAFFCLAWNGFLLGWYTMAMSAPAGDAIPDDLGIGFHAIMLIFPLFHVAIGIFLTYSCIAGFVNKTRIEVSDGRFRLSHGPLPWKGTLDLDSASIQQFYIVQKLGRKGTRSYTLCALLKDDTMVQVLNRPYEELSFIEHQLEELLQIQDARVRGEYEG